MDPKPETPASSPSLQERIAAAIKENSVAVVDRWTKKLVCHRAITIAPIGQPDPLDPNRVRVDFQPGSMNCIGKACGLWNDDEKECFDVTGIKSQKRTAIILEAIDGHARLSVGEKS